MHEPYLWKLLFSFFFQTRFNQTRLDELVDALLRFYLWLFHQCILSPCTKNHFESRKRQVKWSNCLEGLCFHDEVVEPSLRVKLRFPRHPILKCADLRVCSGKQLFVYLFNKRITLGRGNLWRLILWKFWLLCNWLGIQTLFACRSRKKNKLLHVRLKSCWLDE